MMSENAALRRRLPPSAFAARLAIGSLVALLGAAPAPAQDGAATVGSPSDASPSVHEPGAPAEPNPGDDSSADDEQDTTKQDGTGPLDAPDDEPTERRTHPLAPKQATARMQWGHRPANTADLPGRCHPDRLGAYTEAGSGDSTESPADVAARILDLGHRLRREPRLLLADVHRVYYPDRRDAVHAAFEAHISEALGAERARRLQTYAWFLLYMGEFRKLLDYIPERILGYAAAEPLAYGSAVFATSQAQYRLGRYAEATRTARAAVALLDDSPNDTRWHLMVSELARYGPEFFERHSSDLYTTDHIAEWYPNSDWELPFEDVTDTVGKHIERWGGAGGVSFVDFDDDGWDDILLERRFFEPKLYRNNDGSGFEPVDTPQLAQCLHTLGPVADFDNDGHLDVIRACCGIDGSGPLRLLRGGRRFELDDVSAKSGFPDDGTCGHSPTWLDWDLDGDLDLFVVNFCGPSRAYRNDRDDGFVDVTDEAGFKTPGDPAVLATGDGAGKATGFGAIGATAGYFYSGKYPDLVVQGWGWRQLYRNEGDGSFTEVRSSSKLPAGDLAKNQLLCATDYDNDGDTDIVSTSYVVGAGDGYGPASPHGCSALLSPSGFSNAELAGASAVFANRGDGSFEDVGQAVRFLPLGVTAIQHGDWNNDGHEDLVLGMGGPTMQQIEPYAFYQNNGDATFTNMTPFTMQSLWGKGHGLAFADYDHDGHLDLVLNNGGTMPGDNWPSLLLHNTGSENHWIRISLEADPLRDTNAAAIGARVWVTAGELRQVKTLFGGSSGTNSFALHFGLGAHEQIDEIKVRWPNSSEDSTVLRNLAVDQAIVINQRKDDFEQAWTPKPRPPVEPSRLPLGAWPPS